VVVVADSTSSASQVKQTVVDCKIVGMLNGFYQLRCVVLEQLLNEEKNQPGANRLQ
jgi:hypothetical protein